MTLYSKVARSLFMVFVVIVCGGWYSGNRAISQINEEPLADDLLINTPIARAADAAVLSEMQSQEEEFNKHKKRQKEKIWVVAERSVEKRISELDQKERLRGRITKRGRKIIEQSRKMPRTQPVYKGRANDPKNIPQGCERGTVICEDNIFLPGICHEAPEDHQGIPHCFGGTTLHRGEQKCECTSDSGTNITWKNPTAICCDLPNAP